MRQPESCRTVSRSLAQLTVGTVLLCASSSALAGDNTVPIAFAQNLRAVENIAIDIELDGQDFDGDPLTFRVVAQPVHGTLSGTAPALRYTPDEDYTGPDALNFVVNDGQADSQPATVNIIVDRDLNDPPEATPQSVVTNVNAPIAITLRGTDAEGDPLTFRVETGPLHGALSGVAPALTYTPQNGYEGPDSFTFIANDGENDSGPAFVFIDVGVVNARPVAFSRSIETAAATPVSFVLTGADANMEPLTFRVTVPPLNGTLSGQAPNLTYTPEPNHLGADALSFVVNDGIEDSEPGTISIEVGRNAPPVVQNLTFETDLNTSVGVTLLGSDADGDAITFEVVGPPAHGTLSGQAPALTYTPANDYSGIDQFQYVASDGRGVSNIGQVTLLVGVENLPPLGVPRELTTAANTPLDIVLEGSDPEGRPITFTIVDGPAHGSLSGQAPQVLYAPQQGYNGRDSFTFTVSDGELTSEPATIALIIGSLNQIPAALDVRVETPVSTPAATTLRGLDGDGDDLTYRLVTMPTRGTLTGQAPNLTYTPNQGYEGLDGFDYTVNDGQADSPVGHVTIQVGTPNLIPLANPVTASTQLNTPVAVTLDGIDPEGRALTYTVTRQPLTGTVTGNGRTVTYSPNQNFQGIDFFVYTVNDGVHDSDPGVVRVRVGVPNVAPQAFAQLVQVDEDSAVGIVLEARDDDGDELTWEVLTQPSRGTLDGAAPQLRYTPPANFRGFVNFDFRVSDGVLNSNIATVVIQVLDVNDPPVTADSVVTTTEGRPVSFTLTGDDADGENLTFEVTRAPANGTLTGDAPNLTYTPNEGFAGEDSLIYVASDRVSSSDPTTVRIIVDAVNEAPTAADVEATTQEDVPVDIELDGDDPDGDDLVYVITSGPTRGNVFGAGPTVTYVPDAEYSGPDTFRYLVTDGRLQSMEAEVTVIVTPVADPPQANDSLSFTDQDMEVSVTLVVFDPDSQDLTYNIVSQPGSGQLQGTAPNLVYVPDEGFFGDDSFEWTANDGDTTSNVATARIRVFRQDQENVAPTAIGAVLQTNEDETLPIVLTGDDFNGDTLSYTVVGFPSRGQVTGQAPQLTYTPNPDSNGEDSFTFTTSDGEFTSDPAVIQITVTPVNDPPIVFPLLINTNQGRPVTFSVVGDDVDQDSLTFRTVTPPANGTLTGTLPELTYDPRPDFFGDDTMVVTASDGQLESEPATITLRVRRANNTPPTAQDLEVDTDEDSPVDFELAGADADGDLIAFILLDLPEHGNIVGNAPDLHYEPARDYFGEDRLTFLVNDGTQSSRVATVTFTVAPVNDPPVATDVRASTQGRTPVPIALMATDVDGDELTFRVTRAPGNGAASVEGATATYTARDGFSGTDTFEYEVSDGAAVDTATATVEVFDGEQTAPVVTIDNIEAWLIAPVTVTGTVTDAACQTPPIVSLLPLGQGLTPRPDNGGFVFTSMPLPDGVHNLTVSAVSGCTGRTGRASLTLGVDSAAPTVAITGLRQDDVDPEDSSTWPSVDPAQPLALTIQASDGRSGIAEVEAQAVSEDGQEMATLRMTVSNVRVGTPPGGLTGFTGPICDDGEACDGPAFDAAAFGATAVAITVTVRDTTGNVGQTTVRLQVRGLREAIVALRGAAFAQFTESPPALAYLDAAIARLDDAVAQLDANFPANALLSLMQAVGDLHAAARYDEAARFDDQVGEVVTLLRVRTGVAYLDAVANLDPSHALELAARGLARADAHIRASESDDALLALGTTWLWLGVAQNGSSVDTPPATLATFTALRGSLTDYAETDGAPAAGTAADVATRLAVLTPVLQAYVDNPAFSVANALQAVAVLDDAVGDLLPLADEWVWARNWLYDLALVSTVVYDGLLDAAGAALGEENTLVAEGRERRDRGDALREEGRADSFFVQGQQLRCVAAAVDQVTSQTVSDVPDRCCRLFGAWQQGEPRLELPNHCD